MYESTLGLTPRIQFSHFPLVRFDHMLPFLPSLLRYNLNHLVPARAAEPPCHAMYHFPVERQPPLVSRFSEPLSFSGSLAQPYRATTGASSPSKLDRCFQDRDHPSSYFPVPLVPRPLYPWLPARLYRRGGGRVNSRLLLNVSFPGIKLPL
jgi:hypothetical protein